METIRKAPDPMPADQSQSITPSATDKGKLPSLHSNHVPVGDKTAEIRAIKLAEREPDWFDRFFVQPVLESASRQRHISIKQLMENARAKDFTGLDGEPVKLNNNFAPIFARLLVKRYPHIKPYLEMRRSSYDHILEDTV